ncbi:MAG: CARDB domain-containing protein [Geobacteraceae bacterium]|nr:CARDB domain-containing protein [Geobacteraceae bacterium]
MLNMSHVKAGTVPGDRITQTVRGRIWLEWISSASFRPEHREENSMIAIRRSFFCAILLTCFLIVNCFAQERTIPSRLPVANTGSNVRAVSPGIVHLAMPDLEVSLSCGSKATAGANLPIVVTVTNKGTVKALGTSEGPANKAYMVDLVWSADSVIPAQSAVQPVYQGLTREDFVEDMLVLGGRISNTKSILPGKSVIYKLPAYVPKNMAPGVYWLGAYADSQCHVMESRENNNTTSTKVLVGVIQGSNTTVPPGVGFWVMPWGVGNTPLYKIKPTGLTDYTDGLSGKVMNNAPFGARLGFRHGYDNRIPTPQISYYRWLYCPVSGGSWQEFSETIGAHYVRQVGMAVSYPVYVLGPKNVDGKNLYEFLPHNPPTEPGAVTSWPATDWFGDIYSGLLNTPALPEGTYLLKLEVYNSAGVKVLPGSGTFRFLSPTGTAADGTVHTAVATSVVDGGYVFKLHIDNRSCGAVIDAPLLGGGSATDACGFLLYDPAVAATAAAAKIRLAFHATHPGKYAVFSFDVVRSTTSVVNLDGEVAAANVGGFTGDGLGNYYRMLLRSQLLGSCPKGAFAEVLHVYPKATAGWGQRISGYDAHAVRAFALAPK